MRLSILLFATGLGALPAWTEGKAVRLPIGFEPNAGRFAEDISLVARTADYALALQPASLRFSLPRAEVLLRFVGASRAPAVAEGAVAVRANYLLGSDTASWKRAVERRAAARYSNLYPGVDLLLYENAGRIEHDFVLHPGSDPAQLAMRFSGAHPKLDARGDLVVRTASAELRFHAPEIYQDVRGVRTRVSGGYRIERGAVRFRIGNYDPALDLVIDPVISVARFGASGFQEVEAVAIDSKGNTYAVGSTSAADFPVAAPLQKTFGGGQWDVFVLKVDPQGKPVYATYLGGSGTDFGNDIKVDAQGNAIVVGSTSSTNFPVANGYQRTNGGGPNDAFIAKLDATGSSLVYSTYLGGSGDENASAVEVDANGNAYVGGYSRSTNFTASAGAYQSPARGGYDAFVAKFSPAGALVYNAIVGGSGDETTRGIAVDASGAAYIAGSTASTNYPVTAAAAQSQSGGGLDAFVAGLNPAGSQLVYATYFGGSGTDNARTISMASQGGVWIAGETASSNFPVTADATQKSLIAGQPNGFEALLAIPAVAGANLALAVPADAPAAPLTSATLKDLVVCKEKEIGDERFVLYAPKGTSSPCNLLVRYHNEYGWYADSAYAIDTTQGSAQGLDVKFVDAVGDFVVSLGGGATLGGQLEIGPEPVPAPTSRLALPRANSVKQAMVAVLDFTADPHVAKNGLAHAASFATGAVAPGEIVTLFGSNLGPSALATAQLDASGKLSTSVAGTQVLFDGVAAPIVYTSAGQVSAIVPYSVQGKKTTVVRVSNGGVPSSNIMVAPVADTVPGIFTVGGGKGQAAALNQDNSYNGAANPAASGSVVVLFATGEGQTGPAGVDGAIATSVFPKPLLPVSVSIGGKPAELLYYGAAPQEVAGLLQLNVKIPADIAPGDAAVTLTVGSASSQPGVTIAVK